MNLYSTHYRSTFVFYRILYHLYHSLPLRGLYLGVPGVYMAYCVGVAAHVFRSRITPNGQGSPFGQSVMQLLVDLTNDTNRVNRWKSLYFWIVPNASNDPLMSLESPNPIVRWNTKKPPLRSVRHTRPCAAATPSRLRVIPGVPAASQSFGDS